ncbi:LLM class flavin-dependent oxidoreductase [Amycolatopsis sp. NPDC049253]|uniref:LLM class flavin-dependent oxidoreductase n=1 Tax=Amycolatopsis sp. NPDC049253 TaxID=3155274 RepID=UPI00343E5E5B
MVGLSVLELATVEEGRRASEALEAVTSVARGVDELGFQRIWVAEHHGYRSVGSVAPPVLATHLAGATAALRVGSGGVLLPNHPPLAVAEQFTTLAALHPGRIDLGIGRGPSTTDARAVRALRGTDEPITDAAYRAAVVELLGHLAGEDGPRVLPGADESPEPWLLASSPGGAAIAAELGLPLAIGHHIRPGNTIDALTRYRDEFRASRWREQPYVIVCVETLCAQTDEQARELARPSALAMAGALQGRGTEAELPTPKEAERQEIPSEVGDRLAALRETQAYGSPSTVRTRLTQLVERTGADELMLSTPVYDPAARLRSLELAATGARDE